MSGPPPVALTVSPRQRAVLERILRQHSTPQAIARRISIILAAADGEGNDPLAARLATSPNTIRRWRARWAHAQPELQGVDHDEGLLHSLIAEVLADAPRAGVTPTFTAEQIVQIINLACTPVSAPCLIRPHKRAPGTYDDLVAVRMSAVARLVLRWPAHVGPTQRSRRVQCALAGQTSLNRGTRTTIGDEGQHLRHARLWCPSSIECVPCRALKVV